MFSSNPKFITLCFFLIFSFSSIGQEITPIWDLLHNNQRKEALKLAEKLDTKESLDNLLTNALIRIENGLLVPPKNFVNDLMKFPNAEFYLYSHWFNPYIFGDYLDSGFDIYNIESSEKVNVEQVENSTVRNSLHYLKAVTARYQKMWSQYRDELSKVHAIRKWEYCGVFENLNNSGITTIYGPEKDPSIETLFDTQGNGLVNWYESPENPEAYNFFTNHSEYGSGVNYAQTFINSNESQRVNLRVGHGGLLRVWVNDVLVLDQDQDVITEMDAVTYAVNLNKGPNRILVKSATEKHSPYFIIRLEDENSNPLTNFTIDLNKRNYKPANNEQINSKFIEHPILNYFKQNQNNIGSNYITDISLVTAYLRNSQFDKALAIVEFWLEKYPKSSKLLIYKAECLLGKEKSTKYNEIKKNIELNDPDYYVSILSDMERFDELMKLDLNAYNEKLEKIATSVDYPYIDKTIDLFRTFRTKDMDELRKNLDAVVHEPSFPSKVRNTFIQFYDQLLNDDSKTIKELEDLQQSTYNWSTVSLLNQYYKKQNKIDQSLDIYSETLNQFPEDNNSLYLYIELLQSYNKYEESLPYIEKALTNFPYSYKFLNFKGSALQQLGKKNKAIEVYERALEKNGANRKLRTLLLDLKEEKDPLEEFKIDDFYEYITSERGKINQNNYGFNVLLDQINVLKYKESGGRYRGTYIYEITSQQGIDELKEYNLGLTGSYTIYKSEIIRPNKSIIPAERSGSQMVFNNLSVGDVILIDYEQNYSKSGRFYKHYQDSKSFSNYHPVVNKTYRVITHKTDDPLIYTVANGSIEPHKFTRGNYKVYEWIQKGKPFLAQYEDYMPPFEDISTELHISTVENWSEISDWYSDLVRKQIIYDETVKEAFVSIFPNGYKHLTEDERAERIYNYITSTFSYSYVSFKQSGFVPQKPSKVIDTKLGDCKDFSTLFLTLGNQAELESNLVLILTSDYGERSLLLPSTDFNHCIVRVKIDDTYQYLELTSKYLPYKALPISLVNATALEIPFSKGDMKGNSIKTLNNLNRKKAILKSDAITQLGEDKIHITLKTSTTGSLSASYIQKLTENTSEDKLKKILTEDILNRNDCDLTVLEITDKNYGDNVKETSFTASINLNEKPNRIGSLKTIAVPYFANPYNQGIISLEKRLYPIRYINYENADIYQETNVLKLNEDENFVEIPEDKAFEFKNHKYTLNYELLDDHTLKVSTYAETPLDDIMPVDYLDFRKYVQKILESRRQLIGFK